MFAPGKIPESVNCHACGAILDIAGRKGFAHVACNRCGAFSVVPLQFGDFLLLGSIGVGGVGLVYEAIDLPLNRPLALKILPKKDSKNPEFVDRFAREARFAAVNHPNVALVYSFGEHEGRYYLAMELLERGSLDDRIVQLGKLPEAEVLSIGLQIASALRAAWKRGLLHSDVKPGNILFNEDNIPKILDFGLARIHGKNAESTEGQASETMWGTPYYIAPEKLNGQPEDFRSDIYSLGATLFHALAGQPPFDAATAGEVITKHVLQQAFSLKRYVPSIHKRTMRVIARMLAKDPAERYESYDELIQDLAEAQKTLKEPSSRKRFSILSWLRTKAAWLLRVVVRTPKDGARDRT